MLVIIDLDMDKFFLVFKKAMNDWETAIKEIVKYTSVIKWQGCPAQDTLEKYKGDRS